MKTPLSCLLLVGLLASSVGASNDPKDPKLIQTPRIQFNNVVYDFGKTSLVQSLTGTFTFQNVGDGVLELRRPTTSCGCTVAAVKPDKVEQGKKGELVFTLNVAGMNRGKVEKQILVPTNDAQAPTVQLTVKAELVSNYDVAPNDVSFGNLRAGTTGKYAVIVKRVDGKPLQISAAQSTNDMIQTRVEPLPEHGGTAARVWVEVVAKDKPGRLSGDVQLLGQESELIATIPVNGVIVGDVVLATSSMFWGISDPATWPGAFPELMTKRVVRVSLTDPAKTLEIRNLRSTVPDLQLNVVPVEAGKSFDIVAQLTQAPKETVRGSITFETNIAAQPELAIGVLINVLKRSSL